LREPLNISRKAGVRDSVKMPLYEEFYSIITRQLSDLTTESSSR
jgi:hypothetical protein